MSELLITNSEMESWRRCRRKWWLSTFRRLTVRGPSRPGTPFSVGNLVHDALAAYYDPAVRADPVEHVRLASQLKRQEDPTVEDDSLKEEELAAIMLAGYLDWLAETGADQDLEVLGTESVASAELIPGVRLMAKLDAPVRRYSDGARLALEHKTVTSLSRPLPVLKLDSQLLTEHLVRFLSLREQGASNDEAADACHGILYNMLRKVKQSARSKPPFYGRIDVPHNVTELRSHWKHCAAAAQEILRARLQLEAGMSHHTACPPSPRLSCSWDCPFFTVCVMADDGSDFEGALREIYREADPLERYDGADVLAEEW